ncbi:TonB-dependent receptor [Bordetella genomosp. 7]|uniref:TonB-dependent siderophore receptor n=1 Tax=Bordetella genomosp. 7 TaxID=1416805 RepID=A0A261QZ82_9BORD|nr:TonB-dependent receptor [Bordetella genomosp. 7]OZI17702.1 TonB-dependent siderophore receptor [Bordetella genomosp. 7]
MLCHSARTSVLQRRTAIAAGLALLAPLCARAQDAADAPVATLPAISVSASEPTLDQPAATGSFLSLTPLQTPASLDIITNEQLSERGDVSVMDAITQAPGISAFRHPGNGGSSLSSRGFTDSNSVAILYDGIRQYGGLGQTFVYDPWSVDRIEVLRGPASVLVGEGAIGGVVNIIPKKPGRGPIQNEVQAAVGTHDTQRLAFGSGGALDERWSYRVDASGNHSNAGMSLGDAQNAAITAALRLDVSPALNFTLTHAHAWQEPARYFGTPLIDGEIDYSLRHENYNVADSKIIYRDSRTELQAEWSPAAATTVRGRVYYLGSDRDYRNVENYTWQPGSGLIERSAYTAIQHDQSQVGARADAVHTLELAGLLNQVAIGAEINRSRLTHTNNSPYGGTSLVDPRDVDHGEFINEAGTFPRYRNTATQYALFAEDRLVLNEQWSLLGGVRYDHIDLHREDLAAGATAYRRTYTNVGWRVGAVYNVLPTLALYGQYSRAADPVGSLLLMSPANKDFELSQARQIEVGIKQTFWDNAGEWTLAAYHIRKKDLVTRDPDDPSLRVQVGSQSSRGLELTLGLDLGRHWRLDFNGAMLDARYDDYTDTSGGAAVSRRGNVPPDVPERLANLWLSWRFAPQWTASAGLRYVGKRFADSANQLEMAAYTTTNLALQWDARRDLTLALRAYNVFDKQYAETAYYNQTQWLLGAERRVELSAHYRF